METKNDYNLLRNQGKIGAGTRTRTADRLITNQLLYQLSYASINKILKIDALISASESMLFYLKSIRIAISNIKIWRIRMLRYCCEFQHILSFHEKSNVLLADNFLLLLP